MRHLILFDIDGTLMQCGRQVGEIFIAALREVFGDYRRPDGFSFAGKTDPMIVAEMVRATGLEDAEIEARLPRMREVYVRNLEAGLRREGMRLLPGVRQLLESLEARQDIAIGLLTGNWRQGAEVKLSRFDLGRFFAFGAFGDDAADRRGLVPVALERAAGRTGKRFAPAEVLIVGDTALDVDCARAAGVPCLAVSTGFTDAECLRDAGADWVFEDLEQAARELELFVGT